jgi:hypothetical protein
MLVFDPSVDGGPYFGGRIVNNALQQRQMMMLVAGCAMFAVGVLLHAGSYLAVARKPVQDGAAGTSPTKYPASAKRLAYAQALGIEDDGDGYNYAGQSFLSVEDAILFARRG